VVIKDRASKLASAMIELFESWEEYDQAQFYRKGEQEWNTFVAKFEKAKILVSRMESTT